MKKVQQQYSDLPTEALVKLICRAALDQKAENLIALDVRKISDFADYFVIMSGTSTRHVSGLAEAIDQKIGSKRTMTGNTEGLSQGTWVLLDYNDIIVHIFHSETRRYYDLEGLWHDAPRLDLSDLD
ncbi:MAG: ribosome silencing factor [Desulfurivibrionaceae bacterium]|nr:ribosome silencing factor [Desulfobulbales bacterium]MDT8335275.1 ribosome silencing factor [Desulfurivibrionaceae bacterium]